MFQYRQVLVRMHQGESDRDIARARVLWGIYSPAFNACNSQSAGKIAIQIAPWL